MPGMNRAPRLQTERQANQVTAQRFIATVRLVKAMGGGW